MSNAREQELKEIKAYYPDEYLLIEIRRQENGVPVTGILRAHGRQRKDVLRRMQPHQDHQVYFFYNGSPGSPDTAYVL